MKGRQILIESLASGGEAAALMVNGRLEDLLIDPGLSDPTPRPESIHCAITGRPMKGMGGVMVELGSGQTGYLRTSRPPAAGSRILAQVSGWAEPGKAPPVTDRLLLKGRHAILTPGAPGLNIARGIRDPERRAALSDLLAEAMRGTTPELGVIIRSNAERAPLDEISAEISSLRAAWQAIRAGASGPAKQLHAAPTAGEEALRDWLLPGNNLLQSATALRDQEVWSEARAMGEPRVDLDVGFMFVEPTRALTTVDVNTGAGTGSAVALRANLAAIRELPRQLRLRGIGGQIVVDFAPLAKSDRPRIEAALSAALRADGIDTSLAGWTPLGHLELLRKRARRPLSEIKLLIDFP